MKRKEFQQWLNQFPEDATIEILNLVGEYERPETKFTAFEAVESHTYSVYKDNSNMSVKIGKVLLV